jgi:hypothetical protein
MTQSGHASDDLEGTSVCHSAKRQRGAFYAILSCEAYRALLQHALS